MGNEEHLALLKQGVEIWNRWRDKNPYIEPDLTKTDLRLADLREANLSVLRWIPLENRRRHALRHPWLLPSLRCNGWIVVCERDA